MECPKCKIDKGENKGCPGCGYINEHSSCITKTTEQYFDLPEEYKSETNYNGPCPACGCKVIENKCTACLFVGNIIAVMHFGPKKNSLPK